MADLSKSADSFLAEVSANVKKELYDVIAPITRKIADAVNELERALGAGKSPAVTSSVAAAPARRGRKPGRPAKAAAAVKPAGRRGRPPKVVAAAQPAAKTTAKPGKRSARGAMQNDIRALLQKAGRPLSLTDLRNEIMKNAPFKGRNPNTVYTQIVQTIKRIPEIERTNDRKYRLR